MSKATIEIDSDVLDALSEQATAANRTLQQHLRYLLDKEKAHSKYDCFGLGELTPEQQSRADSVLQTEASEALEGYRPLHEEGGYPFELQKQWILGLIETDEWLSLLDKYDQKG